MDIANPQGPLADLVNNGSMSILIEGIGREESAEMKLSFSDGTNTYEDKVKFHLVDVDFTEATPDSGFDDNNEWSEASNNAAALMVPINGTNSFKVSFDPANLYTLFAIEQVGSAAIASLNTTQLTSNNQVFTVTGHMSGNPITVITPPI